MRLSENDALTSCGKSLVPLIVAKNLYPDHIRHGVLRAAFNESLLEHWSRIVF